MTNEQKRRNEPLPLLVDNLLLPGKMEQETRILMRKYIKSIIKSWPEDMIELNDIIRELWYRFEFIPTTRNKVMESLYVFRCRGYVGYGKDFNVNDNDEIVFGYPILNRDFDDE